MSLSRSLTALVLLLAALLSTSFRAVTRTPFLSSSSPFFMSTPSPASSSSTTTVSDSYSSSESSNRDINAFLSELGEILRTPGLAFAGVSRSLQVARAVRTVALELTRNRDAFNDPSSGTLSLPKVLRRVFEEFGATYIKLGQFIASSPTLFPAEYVTEFQKCLDDSPTYPFADIRKIIQDDLKRPLSSIYASIDPVPLASASIAQVHRATLRNGTSVVIKVRKPGVDQTLKADLSFLSVATKLVEFINPSLSAFSLSNIVDDIRTSMLDELDFRREIVNLNNFRSFLEDNNLTENACAPLPYPELSGVRTLTMEFLEGVPLIDLESIKAFGGGSGSKTSPEETLVSALRTWAMSVATNDKFHADVHAGNLLALPDGRVGFIDFGIVGQISDQFRTSILRLFDGLVASDFDEVAKALVTMGATRGPVDTEKFGRELQAVVEQITALTPELVVATAEATQVSADGRSVTRSTTVLDAQLTLDQTETTKIVLDIVEVAERNGLKLPREFGLILKQALYFDRYQKILAPSMDPLRDASVRESFSENVMPRNDLRAAQQGRGSGNGIIIDVDESK